MRNRCLLGSPVSIGSAIVYLAAAILTAGLLSTTSAQSKLPIQRFGVSEFRLTSKGGNGPTIRFSPDGKFVAGASWEQVKLWSFPDGKLLHDLSSEIQTDCVGCAAAGKEFLALERRRMEIYRFDVVTGRLLGKVRLQEVEDERGATTYTLSPDGRWLYMTEVYNHLVVWDTTTGKRQFRKEVGIGKGGRGGISEAGVLTLWDNLFIDRYDVRTGEQLGRKKIYQQMGVLDSNPQGTLIAAYSPNDKSIIFWDTTNDKQVGGMIPLSQEYRVGLPEAALSANGRRFVFWIKQDQWLWNRKSAVYDVETGKLISSFEPPGVYLLEQPEISPDGRYMFLAGGRSVFTPVDTSTGKLVREIPDHILSVEKLAFTPDAHTLLVGSRDKRQAWNIDTGKPGPLFEEWYHTPNIAALDNKSALVAGIKRGGLRLQSIESGAVEREYETGKDKYFSEVQMSVNRKTFVAMENLQGGHIRRWNIADGKVVAERQLPVVNFERRFDESKMLRGLTLGGSRVVRLEQVVPPSKRPDGSIEPGRGDLVLEDWATKTVTNRLPLPALSLRARAANSDGTLLAAAVSDDRTPRPYGEKWGSTHLLVWDIATGWERLRIDREMYSYFGAFAMVAITRDGRLVATVSNKNRVEIWNGFNGYQLDGFDTVCGVSALAFSDDGTLLATGHEDGSVFLWNTRPAWDQSVQPLRINQKMAQQCWKDLAGEGRKPALAWQMLLRNPEQATQMLKANLKQIQSGEGLVGALENSITLPDGERAPLDGASPEPPIMRALQQALDNATTDEARSRYKQLLDTASRPLSPESRRPILGILLAEQLNTTDSEKLIEEIAAGAPGAFETQVAKSALIRIRLRNAKRDKTLPE